jgi:hypothetical protein
MNKSRTSSPARAEITQDKALHGRRDIVRIIPFELWCRIFEECGVKPTLRGLIPGYWEQELLRKESMTLSISHVCQYFRQITLAMPIWWSASDMTRPVPLIETFLERSAQLPVIVTNMDFGLDQSPQLGSIYPILERRILAIDIPVPFSGLMDILRYKNLKHLMIKGSLIPGSQHTTTVGPSNLGPLLDHFECLQSIWWD